MMPFDRRVWAPRERPSTESNNMGESADRAALDWFYRAILSQRISASNDRSVLRNGFIGDGYKVRALSPAQMKVSVSPGLGYYFDPTVPLVVATDAVAPIYQGVMDLSPYRPLVLPEEVQYTVPTPPAAGQSRYDIIEVRPKRELADYDPILTFNVAALNWLPQAPAAFLRYAIDPAEIGQKIWPDPAADKPMYYVKGVAAATGTQVEPTPTPGYVTVGRILVTNGDVSIADTRLVDKRPPLGWLGVNSFSAEIEVTVGPAPGAIYVPTIISSEVPEGSYLLFEGINDAAASLNVYFVSGAFRSVTMEAHALPLFTAANALWLIQADLRRVATDPAFIDAAIQGQLLNAARVPNPTGFGVGSYYRKFYLTTNVQNAGATTTPAGAATPLVSTRYLITGTFA